MMKDQFYIVLPSNSSMLYYADNTTAHFVTQLPHTIRLTGKWNVALTEIQIPMNFQHIERELKERRIILEGVNSSSLLLTNELPKPSSRVVSFIEPGIYRDIDTLMKEINDLACIKHHVELSTGAGGYVTVKRTCSPECCVTHNLYFPLKLIKILGFESENLKFIKLEANGTCTGLRPANLSNSVPRMMMIYTDILEPIVTGDVQSRLLRAVSLDLDSSNHGCTSVNSFSSPMYLPLLFNSFQTIEIDIRDQHGDPLPFDSGTLTVVLHFKRAE